MQADLWGAPPDLSSPDLLHMRSALRGEDRARPTLVGLRPTGYAVRPPKGRTAPDLRWSGSDLGSGDGSKGGSKSNAKYTGKCGSNHTALTVSAV
jgi:hypothetical protein